MTADPVRLRRAGVWLALTNAAGVIVWLGVFMNWVNPTFGTFQASLIGASTFAWPFLVLGTSALALFGNCRLVLRLAAWAAVGLMGAVLIDQTLGAVRDGEVMAPGLRLGLLMGAELVISAGALILIRRNP